MYLDDAVRSLALVPPFMTRVYGRALLDSGEAAAFVRAWAALPPSGLARSVAAVVREAATSSVYTRMPLDGRRFDNLLDLLQLKTLGAMEGGLFDAAARRRIWGPALCPQLAELERSLGGDSYNLVEFVACGLAQNAMLNAAKDPGGEGEGVSGGGPGHAGPHSGGCTCCGSRQGGGNASGAAAGGAGAAAAAAAAEQPPPGDPAGWRVSQLKAFLSSKGVDHKHCLEKGQLADLCREQLDSNQQTAAEPAAAPAPSSGAAADAASPPADAPHPRPVKACAECGAAAGQPGVRLRRCAGCPRQAAPHYCGEQCQTRAWPRHKRECGSRTAAAAATG